MLKLRDLINLREDEEQDVDTTQTTPTKKVTTTKPEVDDTPEEQPEEEPETKEPEVDLNKMVSPGFKVKFQGKPGEYYIIRIMNVKMTNFLVVNAQIGKPVQFFNVKVSEILTDEKGDDVAVN